MAMLLAPAILIFGSLLASQAPPTAPSDAAATEKEAGKFAQLAVTASRMIANGHTNEKPSKLLVAWAIEGLYENRKLAVPPAIRKRLDDLPKAGDDEVLRLLKDVYPEILVAAADAIEETLASAIDAMSRRLEPGARPEDVRSRYIRAKDVKRFSFGEGRPAGVGLIFESDKKTGMLRVVTPIYGGAAYKAGIRAGDIITQIRVHTDDAGKQLAEPKLVSTKGMTRDQAVDLIVGPAGTRIDFVIERSK
jgi:carboxyl-terminal processing protease